jgi:UDP-N-acetyl-D-mannosaminuronate dehydrogenase
VAYKRNIDDTRETPARDIIEILRSHGARVSYHDPLAPELLVGDTLMQSVDIGRDALAGFDCAIIVTDHDALDYAAAGPRDAAGDRHPQRPGPGRSRPGREDREGLR